jgi:hypothetical protein
MTQYFFVDESGDPGLEGQAGSSSHFVIAMVQLPARMPLYPLAHVRRFDKAKTIALQQNVQLIFVILTKLWLLNKIQELALFSIPGHVSLVMEYSGNPGCLAKPIFGGFNSLISRYGYPKIVDLSKILKNDPNYFLPKIRSEILDAICSRPVSISNSESF